MTEDLKILFIGDGWLGSCGRSLCEALRRNPVSVEDIWCDRYFPAWRSRPLRAMLRVISRRVEKELEGAVLRMVAEWKPKAVIAYKGPAVRAGLVREISASGSVVVNVFPDLNPWKQGAIVREALGVYDAVISTKHFHPELWQTRFGYRNRCVFVPHGYDPRLHWNPGGVEAEKKVDVALVATYRAEYGTLMLRLSQVPGWRRRTVRIWGNGWDEIAKSLPSSWECRPAAHGQLYRQVVSEARALIAPVTRDVQVQGERFPGDDDTTRTYELPAMGAAVVHLRNEYVQGLFVEGEEMLFFGSPEELGDALERMVLDDSYRRRIASAGQRRVVPRDSLDSRAAAILAVLNGLCAENRSGNKQTQEA